MKRLKIKNLGPLTEADITLLQKNLIIGLQSSGKSCVLKTACHCSGVEKRMELAQSAEEFLKGSYFIDTLAKYYGMRGYISDDTYIEYETPRLKFSYDHAVRQFTFEWKRNRWEYRRPKISYVPSDRNLVATIPMWSKLPLENDNLLDFMSDWNIARNHVRKIDNVLNLGLSYRYDSSANVDSIVLPSGKSVRLSEGSSGVQSLMPLFVHLQYLFDLQANGQKESRQNFVQKAEEIQLMQTLANHVVKTIKGESSDENATVRVDGMSFFFKNRKQAEKFEQMLSWYLQTRRNEIFLEEPEDNLFPPTQCQLVDWLLENISKSLGKDMLFVATHSPYVLNQFIKDSSDEFRLLITYPDHGTERFRVKSLSKKEIMEVYDNGVDLFFNFEAYL